MISYHERKYQAFYFDIWLRAYLFDLLALVQNLPKRVITNEIYNSERRNETVTEIRIQFSH